MGLGRPAGRRMRRRAVLRRRSGRRGAALLLVLAFCYRDQAGNKEGYERELNELTACLEETHRKLLDRNTVDDRT